MAENKLEISPSLTVHELLKTYPELEDVLIGIAPPFRKLRNPILRRTITKVATLKHISSVGGVSLNELISKLREAVGQPPLTELFVGHDYFGKQPDWFSSEKVVCTVNEAEIKDKDKMALSVLLKETKTIKSGEIIELVTTFLPAPGIDAMKNKGYQVWTVKEGDELIKSYFLKK